MNKLLAAILIITVLTSPVYAEIYKVATLKGDSTNTSIYFNYDQILAKVPNYNYKEILCWASFYAHRLGYSNVYAVRAPFASTDLYWLKDHEAIDFTNDIISNRKLGLQLIPVFNKCCAGWNLTFLNPPDSSQRAHGKDESKGSKPVMDYLYKKSFTVKVR